MLVKGDPGVRMLWTTWYIPPINGTDNMLKLPCEHALMCQNWTGRGMFTGYDNFICSLSNIYIFFRNCFSHNLFTNLIQLSLRTNVFHRQILAWQYKRLRHPWIGSEISRECKRWHKRPVVYDDSIQYVPSSNLWFSPWWRHQTEIFSALLALCAGNSPVSGEFPAQRPVTRNFDVFLDLRLNKRLSKQSCGWWFETQSRFLWSQCNEMFVTPVEDRAYFSEHDDVINWKRFPRNWPFVPGIHRSRWLPRTKASDTELWCFLWSAPE